MTKETANEVPSRLVYVDIMKALCIMLVIVGHMGFIEHNLKAWIYSFHIPVFFMITGLTFKKDEILSLRSYWNFVTRKFRSLMVPYALWAMIYASLSIGNLARIAYGSHRSLIIAGGCSSLWFLPVMFLAVCFVDIMFYLLHYVRYRLFILICILTIGVGGGISIAFPTIEYGYPWGLDISFCAAGFILMGFIFRTGIDNWPVVKRYSVMFAIFGGLGTLLYRFNIPDNGYVNMSERIYGQWGGFIIVALFGGFFIWGLAMLFEKIEILAKGLGCIGRYSLIIFVIHRLLLSLFERFCDCFCITRGVEGIFTLMGTLFISCMIGIIVEKFAPVLCGK